MSIHPGNILHSPSLDNQKIISKFQAIIDDIIKQFQEKQLDFVITIIIQHILSSQELIDNIILSCYLKKGNVSYWFKGHINKLLSEFSLDEHLFILANINQDLISYDVKLAPKDILANIIYKEVRKNLVKDTKYIE